MDTDCIFCKIVNKEIKSNIIYEDKYVFAFLDIADDCEGHTLVVPKKHFTNILDCDKKTLSKVIQVVKFISEHYVKNCGFDGVNIMNANNRAAQQSVFHFHMHILPRKEDDGLDTWPKLEKRNSDLKKTCDLLKLY